MPPRYSNKTTNLIKQLKNGMLTAIKINKMRRLPATFKQQFTTKQLKSNSIINLIITT